MTGGRLRRTCASSAGPSLAAQPAQWDRLVSRTCSDVDMMPYPPLPRDAQMLAGCVPTGARNKHLQKV